VRSLLVGSGGGGRSQRWTGDSPGGRVSAGGRSPGSRVGNPGGGGIPTAGPSASPGGPGNLALSDRSGGDREGGDNPVGVGVGVGVDVQGSASVCLWHTGAGALEAVGRVGAVGRGGSVGRVGRVGGGRSGVGRSGSVGRVGGGRSVGVGREGGKQSPPPVVREGARALREGSVRG
jgi:hypothetical protein